MAIESKTSLFFGGQRYRKTNDKKSSFIGVYVDPCYTVWCTVQALDETVARCHLAFTSHALPRTHSATNTSGCYAPLVVRGIDLYCSACRSLLVGA